MLLQAELRAPARLPREEPALQRALVWIVAFNPDAMRFRRVLGAATSTGADVVVFDNNSRDSAALATLVRSFGATFVASSRNDGLGHAYNEALRTCRTQRVPYLLLLDQDTVLTEGYLTRAMEALRAVPARIAVGGRVVDQRAGAERRALSLVQASGTLIDVELAAQVGEFDEWLFIHHVDQEWFLRARSRGFRADQIDDAWLDHEPGTTVGPSLGSRRWRWYSDDRLFFSLRNTLALGQRRDLPAAWRASQVLRTAVLCAGHLVARPGRIGRLRLFADAARASRRAPLPIYSEVPFSVPATGLPTSPSRPAAAAKRAKDFAGALLMLSLLAPLVLTLALTVKLTSRGPVFFRQVRVGRGGLPFRVFKFRTMVVGAEQSVRSDADSLHQFRSGGYKLASDDPRITRIGRFLRRTSLDELPQLFNVLGGSMSLVGIRPLVPDELAGRPSVDQAIYRTMRPGLTGLWQTCGRSRVEGEARLALDRHYVSTWSLRRDVAILARTPVAVLKSDGAH
jgi:lipopolysaccharide/colanic/teichoic acid biosynthesis glycosyltransferase/GT2 family glycosyltransferase